MPIIVLTDFILTTAILTGKIRDLSYMYSSDAAPFDAEVTEDKALSNALASDPMKLALATVC